MRARPVAVVLVGLVALVTACSTGSTQPGGQSKPQPPSAYDLVLRQVHPDGTVDKATALAAFSLAVAALPDVPTPPGPKRLIPSGSAAVAWLLAIWSQLTPAQQQAARQALESGVAPTAFAAPSAQPDPNMACATSDSPDAGPYRQVLDSVLGDIAGHLGRSLRLTVFLQVNTKQLENQPNGKPSVMYTWPCRGTKTADTRNPTGCTIHVNPYAADAAFDDHARRSFLIHEAMHCFLYDRFGIAYDSVAPWLAEGIPTWAQTALNGADPVVTSHWDAYLQLDKTSLFQRTYDAVGYFAQLANSGVDVWHRVDPMTDAFLHGGNNAAWQATGAGDDFVNSWGPGYARGRHPGRHWDITGYGVPGTKPSAVHFDLLNATTAEAAAPVAGVDLVELNLSSDVVTFAADPGTQGLFGAADGSERPITALIGSDLCTRPGGCTCPKGSAGDGTELPALARGLGYLGISGGLRSVRVGVVGTSLDDFCTKPRQSCLVGTWTSVGFDISSGGGAITEHGGAGVVLRIAATGAATVDFSPMQPIVFNAKDAAGTLRYDGTGSGRMTLPPPTVTTGTFGDAHGDFDNIVVTVAISSPIQATVLDHKPLSDILGLAQGLTQGLGGIDSSPLLGPGGFTCSKTSLTITPPPGSQVDGTWTLSRTGP
ncbi:hypothetical protein [Gandjariella thermophila]|uniref:Lipoprotein n=1 Tax=Gandjariella thermophila TaxID=1931992 RepID=A0A4D4J0J8_9PSEU|nr:hypothetical protein [Gandjariella thermophila]GDY28602.1 hypothetical protein GTS_02350 [Gandjariella thermophila]